jgi:hypothetical protein
LFAEFSFNDFGKKDRRAILDIGAHDFYADRRDGRRQAARGGGIRPHVKRITVRARSSSRVGGPTKRLLLAVK